ncbi:MAG TPA: GH25 family lysozyme [Polyangia bacterium]|nr:GH25 family lysozyme [Polyangia bacterium]
MLAGHFAAWRLWVAHYGADCPSLPTGWKRWTFWQRANTGHIDGINAPVDLDDFAGSRRALRRLRHDRPRHGG